MENRAHPLNDLNLSLEERLIYIATHRDELSYEIDWCNRAYRHYKFCIEVGNLREAIDPLLLMMMNVDDPYSPSVAGTPFAERRLEEAAAMYAFLLLSDEERLASNPELAEIIKNYKP